MYFLKAQQSWEKPILVPPPCSPGDTSAHHDGRCVACGPREGRWHLWGDSLCREARLPTVTPPHSWLPQPPARLHFPSPHSEHRWTWQEWVTGQRVTRATPRAIQSSHNWGEISQGPQGPEVTETWSQNSLAFWKRNVMLPAQLHSWAEFFPAGQ